MNYYIVALNENDLGETVLAGKSEKLIKTENTIEGRTKWTVQSMPNIDGVKKIADQESINESQKQESIANHVQSIKDAGNDYVTNIFGSIVAAGIGMVTTEMNKPLALSVKNDFLIPVSNHVTETCTAITNGGTYNFNLSQFTTEITEQEIRTEAGL